MIKMTDNSKELAKRLEGRGNYAEEVTKKLIAKATFLVEGTVKQGIQGGPATGGSVTRYHDGARVTHQVSSAGEYPRPFSTVISISKVALGSVKLAI